jgi:hypothetical protein
MKRSSALTVKTVLISVLVQAILAAARPGGSRPMLA